MADLVEHLVAQFDIPMFTTDILIQRGAIPHSHPIITLNTRSLDPIEVLGTFVHEQMHWFVDSRPNKQTVLAHLANAYSTPAEFDSRQESFLEHIVVCWNTRNFLKTMISATQLDQFYRASRPYPQIERLVETRFEEVGTILGRHSMIAPLPLPGNPSVGRAA